MVEKMTAIGFTALCTVMLSVEAVFQFHLRTTYANVTFTDSVVSDGDSLTVFNCARQCFRDRSCVTFTYVPGGAEDADRGQCRGHSKHVAFLNDTSIPTPGATTFCKWPTDPTNVALHQPTKQSSHKYFPGGLASFAVDGKFVGMVADTCTHTDKVGLHWWRVHLPANFDVFSVIITNRADCCGEKLRKLDIDVVDEKNDVRSLCVIFPGPAATGSTEELHCDNAPLRGSLVKIAKYDKNSGALAMCEVQVMAVPAI